MLHLAFMTNTYRVSVAKHKGQNNLGYLGTCGGITAKYTLRQIKWDCTDWMHLAKGSEKWVPQHSRNVLTTRGTISCSIKPLEINF